MFVQVKLLAWNQLFTKWLIYSRVITLLQYSRIMLNHNVFLHNIKVICPEIFNFGIDCYTLLSRLFVRGKRNLKSQEGIIQGNSIAMDLYTLGITPLMTTATSPSESMHHSSSNPFHNVAFADKWRKEIEVLSTIAATEPRFNTFKFFGLKNSVLFAEFKTIGKGHGEGII